MRIDLSDLDRLEGIAAALARLFWCLMALAFFTAILGSAGTGLLVLILGAASFVVRAGLEDFARSRREGAAPEAAAPVAEPATARLRRSGGGRPRESAPRELRS